MSNVRSIFVVEPSLNFIVSATSGLPELICALSALVIWLLQASVAQDLGKGTMQVIINLPVAAARRFRCSLALEEKQRNHFEQS